MTPEKIAQLRALVDIAEQNSIGQLGAIYGARFDFRAGAYEMRLAGVSGTSTMSRDDARKSWLRAARKRIERAETESDPINLQGSGPAPITAREG